MADDSIDLGADDLRIVLRARCRECFRSIRVLTVSAAVETTAEAITAAASWSDRWYGSGPGCECGRPLPEISTLRSYVAEAIKRGLDDTRAPLTVRI